MVPSLEMCSSLTQKTLTRGPKSSTRGVWMQNIHNVLCSLAMQGSVSEPQEFKTNSKCNKKENKIRGEVCDHLSDLVSSLSATFWRVCN